MDANIDVQILLESRIALVDKLVEKLRSWDGVMESGVAIIETNQVGFEQLKLIEEKLSNFTIHITEEDKYRTRLNILASELNKLSLGLKRGQGELLQGMEELNKKNKVMNSYISVKQGTVFVDKDV